jgi:uncharacterized membrane-anchored protein
VSRGRRLGFFGVVAVLVAVPLAVIGYNELKLATGEEVRLRTEPVDPIDFFRGRYVTLNYEISRVPLDVSETAPGTTVYVPLRDVGEFWKGQAAMTERPSGGRFIRGRVGSGGQIRYGIETYFTDERKAKRYENAAGSGTLYVDVILDDEGGAKIQELHVGSQG